MYKLKEKIITSKNIKTDFKKKSKKNNENKDQNHKIKIKRPKKIKKSKHIETDSS